MKKFLSVLLALAVAFTFTFGSTMSAFATFSSGEYSTTDEQKEILAAAKNLAVTKAVDITENYDSTVIKGSSADDITTITIAKASIEKAIEAVYAAQLDEIIDADDTDLNDYVTFAGNYDTTKKNIDCADVVLVADKMLADAKDAAQAYYVKAEKNELEAYKAYLCGLVDQIDTSIYTDTVQDTPYTVGTETYDTSAKAAAAWIAYYKAIINNAVLDDDEVTNSTPKTTEKWEAASLKAIYDAVFNRPIDSNGTPATTKVVVVKDADTVDATITTGLIYKLSATLSTKASEAGSAATLAAAKASAIAKLAQVVADYKATNAYNATKQDAEIDAYTTVLTYRINNLDDKTAVNTLASQLELNSTIAGGSTYSGYIAAGEKYKADMATAKTKYTTLGYTWNDAEAAKAEVVALLSIYNGGSVAVTKAYLTTADTNKKYDKIVTTDLTASAKAAAKIDYSEVVAEKITFVVTENTDEVALDTFKAPATVTNLGEVIASDMGDVYFAKEWESVKAVIDTYNAAVDAAKTSKDITDAGVALYKALVKISDAGEVFDAVNNATGTYGNLNAYAKLVASQSKKTTIYVTFVDTDAVTTEGTLTSANVYGWMINKGASTQKEAEALYADAKAVIDAYKTLDDLKAEAAAVQAAIVALPAKPVLADKDAVIAAADAYAALPAVAKNYVTSKSTLDKAVAAVKAAEEYALKSMAAALPKSVAAITIADKDAITAYKEAYEAYKNTDAYATKDADYTNNTYSYNQKRGYAAALEKVQALEADSIKAAYDALDVKYQANKLTAADADAVKALQDALAAYIGEYATGIEGVNEFTLSKIADVVAAAVAEEAWTTTDVKASLFDSSRKLTIWRTSKTSIRVTSVGSVADIKDHGYTVKYKFYKKAPGSSTYKLVKTTTSNKYTYTNLKKGTNKFQVKVCVYDADGKLVASKWTYYRAAKIK